MTNQITKAGIIIGNLVVISPFIGAFIWPERYTYFVYHTAVLIFVIEFLSIHSSAMIQGFKENERKSPTILLLGVYVLFAAFFCFFLAKSPYPLIIFIIRLLVKLLTPPQKYDKHQGALANPVVRQALLILGVTFGVVFLRPILSLIPLSDTITSARPADANGLFLETPQTVLAWGVIYFALDAYLDIRYRLKTDGHTIKN